MPDYSKIKRDKLMEFRQIVCCMSGKIYQVSVNELCLILCYQNKKVKCSVFTLAQYSIGIIKLF